MSDKTGIEWADSTFNPWMGCTKVSPACDHCYAERDTARFGRVQWGAGQPRVRTSAGNWKKPLQWNAKPFCECPSCGWRGEQSAAMRGCDCPSCMQSGVLVSARRRVFCASLADVFDNDVPREWRYDLLWLISNTPNLDWMLLTKRIGNAHRMLTDECSRIGLPWSPERWPNVWIGATICNQEEADRDIQKLLSIPAAVRFLSMEPLLGPVSLRWLAAFPENAPFVGQRPGVVSTNHLDGLRRLDWVIVGGESGPNARPMHPDWARVLRHQCAEAGVPFLFKQWGEWRPISEGDDDWYNDLYRSRRIAKEGESQEALDDLWGRTCTVPDGVIRMDGALLGHTDPGAYQQGTRSMQVFRVGKHAAGRLLDGVQHDGYPKGGAA